MSVGTTTNNWALSATGGRNAAYSAITGSSLWWILYHDGTNLRSKTSPDGVTWSDDSTNINGGGTGPNSNQTSFGYLQADAAGNLYWVWGWNNTNGNALVQKRTSSAWFASGITFDTNFEGFTGVVYENGGHVYVHAYGRNEKFTYEVTDPASAGSMVNTENYTITQTASGSGNAALEISGSNIITFAVDGAATPALRTFSYAGTLATGPSFPTPTSRVSNANLQNNATTGNGLAVASDGTTIHIIRRVSGTGWIEDTFDGTTYTTGSTLSVMTDSDRYPAIMYDGTTFHLFWCKQNAANDYGIGYAAYLAGAWTAQTDVQAHNAVNRTFLTVSRAAHSGKAMVTWLEGTASPWTIQSPLVTLAGASTFVAPPPYVISQARNRAATY
jgi:hypothetical protein